MTKIFLLLGFITCCWKLCAQVVIGASKHLWNKKEMAGLGLLFLLKCCVTSNYNFRRFNRINSHTKQKLSLYKILFLLIVFFPLYLFIGSVVNAQLPNYNQTPNFLNANKNWALTNGTGLTFSTSTPSPFAISANGTEGFAAVSSRTTGNLLFYTNGGSVWKANHQTMPNGTELMGNSINSWYGTFQGSLIVPFIADTNKYYLFSLAIGGQIHSNPSTGIKGSLFYSIVDMNLDNNNGDVDVNNKNIMLDTNALSEGLIAIPGCNNDIWIVVHSFNQDPQIYKAYHITKDGVNHTPVISSSKINGTEVSSIKASSDRKKIVFMSQSEIEISHFDPSNGNISLPVSIQHASFGIPNASRPSVYGGIFSPDNSKLYLSQSYRVTGLRPPTRSSIWQYNVDVLDSILISSSKQIVDTNFSYYDMRLYNDTIYSFAGTAAIHRINQPNSIGTACDFQPEAINLTGWNTEATLGSDVVFAIPSDTVFTVLDTVFCPLDWPNGITLTATNTSLFTGYLWSNGDSSTTTEINNPGTYWVKYGECNHHYVDTFRIRRSDLITTITINGFELGTTGGPFASYQWYLNDELIPGADSATFPVAENGLYTVEITDEYGCIFRSDEYKVDNVSINNIRIQNLLQLYPNPTPGVITIQSSQSLVNGIIRFVNLMDQTIATYPNRQGHAFTFDMSAYASGIYFIEVEDAGKKARIKVVKSE